MLFGIKEKSYQANFEKSTNLIQPETLVIQPETSKNLNIYLLNILI